MDGNPDIDITGDEIATAEQRRLHRADQKRRLQVQVERALRALEAVPDPKTFVEVERMCVTLGALAELEGYFQVSGFEALAERLKGLGAGDLLAVLQALSVDEVDFSEMSVGFSEAVAAVVAAFEAMNA